MKVIPLVISGGIGSRLWPASRRLHPKPFIELDNSQTIISQTYKRLLEIRDVFKVYTVTNDDLFYLTKKEFDSLSSNVEHTIITEPYANNTAAAIALSAKVISEIEGEDSVIIVLPADHLISPVEQFINYVDKAVELAISSNNLVVFGIEPEEANTGYGYIQHNGEDVISFHEKPNKRLAEKYIKEGYLWNAGLFCFTAKDVLEKYSDASPSMYEIINTLDISYQDMRVSVKDADRYKEIESISFDHAVLEKAKKIKVVHCDFSWSDIGTWNSFSKLYDADHEGNVFLGNTVSSDTRNTFIRSSSNRVIATAGVEDLIIIDSTDALLIMDKGKSQEIKHVVKKIGQEYSELSELHDTVYRPWGTYTVLEGGEGFKLKRIVVYPGQSLSLQMHHHRSEHWIVVSGMAKVINDDKEMFVSKNESTYIKAGHKHRLTNPGVIECVLIEVQVGDYLEEDDIIRFDDVYGRN